MSTDLYVCVNSAQPRYVAAHVLCSEVRNPAVDTLYERHVWNARS